MRSIFVSYAREDQAAVLHMCEQLKERGFTPWIDVDNLLPGQDWEYEIDKAIRTSSIFIACLSTRATSKRGYVHSELRKALKIVETIPEGQVFLIPLRLEPCDVPTKLAHLHWVDYFTQDGPAKLINAVIQYFAKEEKLSEHHVQASGLTFANIAIERSNLNWVEDSTDDHSPFGRSCPQYFRLANIVYGADPCFDITVMNVTDSPVILTAVGVEIVRVAYISYVGGVPEAAKITQSEAYTIEIPDICSKLRQQFHMGNHMRTLAPVDLYELVSTRVPDPIYLEPRAPFRYGLLFDKYAERMTNYAILRFWVFTHRGEARSHDLQLFAWGSPNGSVNEEG